LEVLGEDCCCGCRGCCFWAVFLVAFFEAMLRFEVLRVVASCGFGLEIFFGLRLCGSFGSLVECIGVVRLMGYMREV